MANEINILSSIGYSKNHVSSAMSLNFSADQTGDKLARAVQSITTTEVQLDKGGVGTIGYLAVRNLDLTNFVLLGHATGSYAVKLLAGKGTVVPWNGTAVYAIADTAPVEVEYLILEA